MLVPNSVILIAILWAIPALAQSATNLTALQGLAPISELSNTARGKAALAANLDITAAVQDGRAKQPLPPERWGFMSQAAGVGGAGAVKVTRYRF